MKRGPFFPNRRQFLKIAGGAAALLGLQRRAFAYQSPRLAKFVQPLRHFLSPDNLLLAESDGTRLWPAGNNGLSGANGRSWSAVTARHYTIRIGQFQEQLHPSLDPTTLWGYFQGSSKKHLGPSILADKNVPTQITFVNELPPVHPLPVDTSTFFRDANTLPNKASVHLHGGFIPWTSDGGPYDWFLPAASGGGVGPSFQNNVIAPGNAPGSAEYYFPNQQSGRLLWYHDHAHDLTRINAYAGIASAYVLRDPFENNLIGNGSTGLLPGLGSAAEIPLVFQDKVFVGEDIESLDPTWPGPTTKGSLWYPHAYELPETDPSPFGNQTSPPPHPSVVPEMFGDTMLVNGTVYPFLEVQPRRYRFRLLNACNARVLNLQLYVKDNSPDGISLAPYRSDIDPNNNVPVLAPTNPAGPAIYQIGTEGGFLPSVVRLNSPPQPIGFVVNPGSPIFGNISRYTLMMAPAERADLVIDFKGFENKTLILYNDCPAPAPGGELANDLYFGVPGVIAGMGPNTRTLMEIRVGASGSDSLATSSWLTQMSVALASRAAELAPLPQSGALHRPLTLNEAVDENGRLIQMIGTNVQTYNTPGFFGRFLEEPATENPAEGAVEVWEFFNLTGDVHPLHFHLVNVQIVNRQPFNVGCFPQTVFTGPARMPDANERGWKETVRMNPGEVTRVVMKFELPNVPFVSPGSTRETLGLPGAGADGSLPSPRIYHEYVYHCHILEHEEHDMMRPMVVTGRP